MLEGDEGRERGEDGTDDAGGGGGGGRGGARDSWRGGAAVSLLPCVCLLFYSLIVAARLRFIFLLCVLNLQC